MSTLSNLVFDKIRSLPSREAAADFFGYSETSIQSWVDGRDSIPLDALEKVFDVSKLAPKLGQVGWGSQTVCVLLPAYKTTNPVSAFSLLKILDRTKMAVMLDFGDAFIAHSRNKLACNFLKSKSDWALTLDDDMVIPCGDAAWFNGFCEFGFPEKFAGMNALERLMSHGKTLVGALYFGRWKKGKPVYAEGASNKSEEAWARRGPHDICKPTKWVGTGCMLINRSVFTDIEKRFPDLARDEHGANGNWFTSSEHDLQKSTEEALQILSDEAVSESARISKAKKLVETAKHVSSVHSTLGIGEDVQFCVRATQAGHQPHVDCGLVCGHMGQFIYGPKKAGWES